MKLKDKVAIVTGASSGIGKALAISMAGEGAKLVLGARSKEKLDELVTDINYQGHEAIAVQTDVSNENDRKSLFFLQSKNMVK